MNVLRILPELNAGGVERVAVDLTEALTAAGHGAHVLSAGGRLAGDIEAAGGVNHFAAIGSKNILTFPKRIRLIRAIINQAEIDLVHVHSRAPAWPAMFAARAEKVPFLTTYHGVYNSKNALKTFYNSVMARGDHVIANSDFTKAHIIKTHGTDPAKITTIHRGVDMAAFDPAKVTQSARLAKRKSWGATKTQKLILLPGRLTRWKGQGVAIDALASLPAQYRLVLLGDAQGRDDYVAELKAKAARLNLQDRVIFAGHDADVVTALAAADIVVSASTDPEAFGRVAAEAQAMEKPIIATAHGGALETVLDGRTGLLTAIGEPSALARAVLQAEAGLPDVGASGRARIAKNFSKTALQEATLALYERMITDE